MTSASKGQWSTNFFQSTESLSRAKGQSVRQLRELAQGWRALLAASPRVPDQMKGVYRIPLGRWTEAPLRVPATGRIWPGESRSSSVVQSQPLCTSESPEQQLRATELFHTRAMTRICLTPEALVFPLSDETHVTDHRLQNNQLLIQGIRAVQKPLQKFTGATVSPSHNFRGQDRTKRHKIHSEGEGEIGLPYLLNDTAHSYCHS